MKSEKWIVCRVCLEQPKESMQTIFSEDAEKDLTRMIFECGGVPIKQFDHYPDKICSKCLKLLQISHTFRVTCQRSYKHLSRFIAPVEVDHTAEYSGNDGIPENEQEDETGDVSETEQIQYGLEDAVTHEVLVEIADENAEADSAGDEIAIKLEQDAIKHEFKNGPDEFYESMYETYKDLDEVQETERAPSEISAEIEFLDEFEELEETEHTSDEEFVPNAAVSTRSGPKRRRNASMKKTTGGNKKNVQDLVPKKNQVKSSVFATTTSSSTGSRIRQQRNVREKKDGLSKYICDICGNMYHSQGRLTEHIKLHSGIKPHECEICGYRFAQTQQLTRHMNTHTGNRPYKCNYCPAAFADLSTRNKHHRIHTNERPYVCDVCGKTFTYTNTLKFHKMIHTGEKPHVCDICGRGFQQAYKLRNHKQTHEKRGIGLKVEMEDSEILQNVYVSDSTCLLRSGNE